MSALRPDILEKLGNNPEFVDKSLLVEINELLHNKPDAIEFLNLCIENGEIIDDIIDEGFTPELLEKQLRLHDAVNNCNYWMQHKQYLWVIGRLIHNTYFDSVKWESSTEEWKRIEAKCMSHCGYMMLMAVILIECGEEVLNKYSLRIREHAHMKHCMDIV